MRYLFIIFVYFLMETTAQSQEITYPYANNQSIVRVTGFYQGCGKIFSNQNYLIPSSANSIVAPTPDDISQAELLMSERFGDLAKAEASLTAMVGKEYRTEYREFYRQYAGANTYSFEGL